MSVKPYAKQYVAHSIQNNDNKILYSPQISAINVFTDQKVQRKYIFQSGIGECKKCQTLDGVEVTEDVWCDENEMKKLGFWKQNDGTYKPHPHCRCHWKEVRTDDNYVQLETVNQKIIDYIVLLNHSKEHIKSYVQITRNNLLFCTQNLNTVLNSVGESFLILDSAVSLMNSFFNYVDTEYKSLRKALNTIKNQLKSDIGDNKLLDEYMRFIAERELEIEKINIPSKKKHYERLNLKIQQVKYLPKSPVEAIQRGFIEAKPEENQYHGLHLGNRKYYHPISGQEVVYDKNKNIVFDDRFLGTYNFGKKTKSIDHFFNDVLPYWLWGNSPEDPTDTLSRIIGPIWTKKLLDFFKIRN